jgi:cell division protein ZipA
MENNFRNVLIIISVIIIGAIFIHGLWTIRKQKNPYKLKTKQEKIEPVSRDFDGSGFDQDGVGQVTVKMQPLHSDLDDSFKQEPQFFDERVEPSDHTPLDSAMGANLDERQTNLWSNDEAPKVFSKDELGDDLSLNTDTATTVKREPLYQEPVTNAKPARAKPPIAKIDKTITKKEQIEINFSEAAAEIENEIGANQKADINAQTAKQPINKQSSIAQVEPQVIVLSVVMPANQQMVGAALLPSLLTLGLKYGEMNIFHRHQDNAGNGDVTFSLANMMKPGSFDLDSIETFATAGISLFMMLPNNGDAVVVFEQMLNAAKHLANEFNAQVLDDKRNLMTSQTEQDYMNKISEFYRQNSQALT